MNKEDIQALIYKYTLINATKHKGKAQRGAVVGVLMGSHPDFRKDAEKIILMASEIVDKVNQMDLELQNRELDKIGVKKTVQKKKEKGLTDLPQVHGEVILRFAPNPSGPLHIGHARAAILNQEYVKRYKGKLILRMEDTDPRRVDLAAYQMIEEDLNWLGVHPQEKIVQSDRIPIYHEYAEKLIRKKQAYMCLCAGSEFKKLKDSSQACPCRSLSVEENLARWKDMPNMSEGEAVLRIKTDLTHKNPAIRDWVAMRIVEHEHPRIGSKFRVYPLMNFAVAVDDHLMGVTHVLRGKDHLANSEKQKYLYDHLGWTVPEFIHYGRLKMEDVALSTSQARQGIKEGLYTGWDDPRLGTIRAIARRGIKKEALKRLMLEIGIKIADSTVTWKKIYGLNRTILERQANRYFAVFHPEKFVIERLPNSTSKVIKRALHPDFLDRGYRELLFDGEIYLDKADTPKHQGKVLRLIDTVNICFQKNKAVFHSSSLKEARIVEARIVQWVPVSGSVELEMIMPDNSVKSGFSEPATRKLKVGDVVQLERVGFARLDQKRDGKLSFYYAHS